MARTWKSSQPRQNNGWLDGKPARSPARSVKDASPTLVPGSMLEWPRAKWMAQVSGAKSALARFQRALKCIPVMIKGAVYILVNFSKTQQTVSLLVPDE